MLQNFNPDEMDFRSVFPALRSGKYDAIGVYIVAAGHHAFFSQAQSAGVKFKALFGTNGFESAALNNGVEELVEGALFANTAVDSAFRNRYLKRFGTIDQLVDAALAYEFAVLVKDLFKNMSAPQTPNEFIERFALTAPRSSVCGEYIYRDSQETGKYFSFPVVVGAMKQGNPEIRPLTPVIAAQSAIP